MTRKVSTIITDDEYAALEADAYESRRSVSATVRMAVAAWLGDNKVEEPKPYTPPGPEVIAAMQELAEEGNTQAPTCEDEDTGGGDQSEGIRKDPPKGALS